MKFCSQCGASVTYRIAPDEDRERHVCDACDTVHYINPKVIVGCLPTCLLYTSPSPRDGLLSRMPSSA